MSAPFNNSFKEALERLHFFGKMADPPPERIFDISVTPEDEEFLRDICGIEVDE